jgi:hypothetical protein
MSYIWSRPAPTSRWNLSCCMCNQSVLLETSKTDDCGQAIHEGCYVLKLKVERTGIPPTGR